MHRRAQLTSQITAAVSRLVQTLGLHRRRFYFFLDPIAAQRHHRVFWVPYILDVDAVDKYDLCPSLCLHYECNKMPEFGFGNEKPNYNVAEDEWSKSEYEQGKFTIAALSLTSRDMREVSQPILHHCFSDDASQRKTTKFLRTLVAQPRLAGCVRVLALPKEWSTLKSEYPTRGEFELWNEVITRLGIPPPRWVSRVLMGDEPTWLRRPWACVQPRVIDPREAVLMSFVGTGPDSRLQKDIYASFFDFFKDLRLWQQFILVGLCSPSLTHLAVSRIYGSSQDFWGDFPDLLGPGQPL